MNSKIKIPDMQETKKTDTHEPLKTVEAHKETKKAEVIVIDQAFEDEKNDFASSHKEIIVIDDQGWYSLMVPKWEMSDEMIGWQTELDRAWWWLKERNLHQIDILHPLFLHCFTIPTVIYHLSFITYTWWYIVLVLSLEISSLYNDHVNIFFRKEIVVVVYNTNHIIIIFINGDHVRLVRV